MAAPMSARLLSAAQTLAAQIEGGAYDALTPGERCDLRALSLALSALADLAETSEAEHRAMAGLYLQAMAGLRLLPAWPPGMRAVLSLPCPRIGWLARFRQALLHRALGAG